MTLRIRQEQRAPDRDETECPLPDGPFLDRRRITLGRELEHQWLAVVERPKRGNEVARRTREREIAEDQDVGDLRL